jgi:Xaa-Pro dipeptidase
MSFTAGLGTMALPEGGRVDFARLREDRHRRLFEAVDRVGVDALVLGRPANVVFASGARQLWTAGARPFGPGAVVVKSTGRTHLLSTWDDGVPAEIAHEELFGLRWNPVNLLGSLQAIPGLNECRRVGTDSFTPGFGQFLAAFGPSAEVVDASGAMWAVRAIKSADEIACVDTATALAESVLRSLNEALRTGVSERELLAVAAARLATLGVPAPATESVVCVTSGREPATLRYLASERTAGLGDPVVLAPGALFAGYEGAVGRTVVCGRPGISPDLAERCRAGLDALESVCRAGATGADLKRAWEATGEPLPATPIVYGLGLGVEPPVVAPGCGDDDLLAAGMVVALTSWVATEGVGGWLERATVLVGDGGATRLSR